MLREVDKMKLEYDGEIEKEKAYVLVNGKRFVDGDEISKKEFETINDASWKADGTKAKVTKNKIDKSAIDKRVADYKEDLADDGKRNFSNDPTKDSPGRKTNKEDKESEE